MIKLNASTTIYRPIKQVFDFVSESKNDFEWQYGILDTARISDSAENPGVFFRRVGHFMGRRVLGTFKVTEFLPNQKYGFKSISGPFISQTSFLFEIAEGYTMVNLSLQIEDVNFFDVNENVIHKKMKKQIKEDLSMLKYLLEEKQNENVLLSAKWKEEIS